MKPPTIPTPCPVCHGHGALYPGTFYARPCHHCAGQGVVKDGQPVKRDGLVLN